MCRIRSKRGSKKSTCSKCGKPIEESRLSQKYCKSCHAEYMRLHRPKHRDLNPVSKKKANARSYAHTYLKRGLIKKLTCSVCGKEAEMHHEDYDKPADVKFLCREHHLEYHENINKYATNSNK